LRRWEGKRDFLRVSKIKRKESRGNEKKKRGT